MQMLIACGHRSASVSQFDKIKVEESNIRDITESRHEEGSDFLDIYGKATFQAQFEQTNQFFENVRSDCRTNTTIVAIVICACLAQLSLTTAELTPELGTCHLQT